MQRELWFVVGGAIVALWALPGPTGHHESLWPWAVPVIIAQAALLIGWVRSFQRHRAIRRLRVVFDELMALSLRRSVPLFLLGLILSGSGWGIAAETEAVIVASAGHRVECPDGPDTVTIKSSQMIRLRAGTRTTADPGSTTLIDSEADAKRTAYLWQLASPPAGYNIEEWTSPDRREVIFSCGNDGAQPLRFEFLISIARDAEIEANPPLLVGTRLLVIVTPVERGSPPESPRGPDPSPIPVPGPEPSPRPPPRGDPPVTPMPDPAPAPVPPPGPGDDELSGLFGLGPKLRDVIQQGSTRAGGKRTEPVASDQRPIGLELADVYRQVSVEIANGKLSTNPAIAASRIKAMNAAVLKSDAARQAWNPVIDWLSEEFMRLAQAGRLSSKEDLVIATAEVSLGFMLGAGVSDE
jgi:hypothetical protein